MITYDKVTELEPHKFCVDASDLGIEPGSWPSSLKTNMGNRLPFLISHHGGNEVHYRQKFGLLKLIVFND